MRPGIAISLAWTVAVGCATLWGATLGGCGGKSEPELVNRSAWQSTFSAALDALGRHDYEGLQALLSPVGRQTLEADLRTFCSMVAHPVEGPRVMEKIRRRWPEVPNELVEGVRAGRVRDAWTLFLRAGTPAGVSPQSAGMRLDPAHPDTARAFYRYPGGSELAMDLQRVRGQWSVDKLELGSP